METIAAGETRNKPLVATTRSRADQSPIVDAMNDANKYSFSNVLVADTRLHVNLNESGARQPEVLVLNNKLTATSKCHKLASCACCLRVERPEFRRRSSVANAEPAPECFASCHDRRSMSIELSAQAQLSGKLVILALSRAENLFEDLPNIPLKCHTHSTWSFSKFEPSRHLTSETGQVYYSRLEHGQVPSLLIDTLEFHLDSVQHKEIVSLSILSNIHRTHERQVSMKETLLVAELNCRPWLAGHTTSLDGFLTEADDKRFGPANEFRKMHILILINREIHASAARARNDSSAVRARIPPGPVKVVDPPVSRSSPAPTSSLATTSYLQQLANTTSVTLQSKRAIASQTSATSIYPKLTDAKHPVEHPRPVDELNVRPPKSHSQSAHMSPTGVSGASVQQHRVELSNNDNSQMGPPYLSDTDALRVRLKSGGLIVLALSSLLVILTYTACLLFYLKFRNRNRSKGTIVRNTVATLDGPNTHSTVVQVFPKTAQPAMNISEPFNLQMGEATRTRLNMMLGRKKSGDKQTRRCEPKKVIKKRATSKLNHQQQVAPDADHYQSTGSPFGSIRVVRAIRHAATLARSRFKGSRANLRYRPNLNVIPESELEQQQSPRRDFGGLYANFISPQSTFLRRSKCVSPEQLETLVKDAMSPNCSHHRDKIVHQQNATLFSRPIDAGAAGAVFAVADDDAMQTGEDPISRSRILKQIKQDDLYEEHKTRLVR